MIESKSIHLCNATDGQALKKHAGKMTHGAIATVKIADTCYSKDEKKCRLATGFLQKNIPMKEKEGRTDLPLIWKMDR